MTSSASYTASLTNGKINNGYQGQQGPAGNIGPKGPKGPQGPQGIIGPRGYAGEKGDYGDTGPRGLQGPQGIIGPRGYAGEKGDYGDTGPRGLQGPQGIIGPRGYAGVKGDYGDTGPKGQKGDIGVNSYFYFRTATNINNNKIVVDYKNGDDYIFYIPNNILTQLTGNFTLQILNLNTSFIPNIGFNVHIYYDTSGANNYYYVNNVMIGTVIGGLFTSNYAIPVSVSNIPSNQNVKIYTQTIHFIYINNIIPQHIFSNLNFYM